MAKSRYNKSLTVILVIVIIAIVGLLIYFGIDVYRKYYIEKEAGDAVKQFEDQINEIASISGGTGGIDGNTTPIDVNGIFDDKGNSASDESGNREGSGVKYKGYDGLGIIEIPATDVKYPIIADYEMSIDAMNKAIVKMYPGTINLNEIGNTVFVGHNYHDGTFFSNNKRLENGDKIYITDNTGRKVTYEIYKKYETSTSDSEYMTRDTNGKREISLSTCTDDTKMRLIIWAREV